MTRVQACRHRRRCSGGARVLHRQLGYPGPNCRRHPAVGLERHRHRLDRDTHARSRAIPAADLLAFLRAKHPVRDKTLWWLLYESAARAGEVLALDIDDLDLPRRRAVVIGKGGRAELIGWETRTARLLPRHLAGREQGPLFLTDLASGHA